MLPSVLSLKSFWVVWVSTGEHILIYLVPKCVKEFGLAHREQEQEYPMHKPEP
jgi:hypothetical protein